ncbi:MAG TPA: hypothetical protein VGB55_13825, partial [Tepidisphaeraceae bacterium]
MTGIIEWTCDANCWFKRPDEPLGPPRWDDDHLYSMMFVTEKEYDFFAAVAGVRNRFGREPLIPTRGMPKSMSWLTERHFESVGDDCVGWLHLSEIKAAMAYMAGEDR